MGDFLHQVSVEVRENDGTSNIEEMLMIRGNGETLSTWISAYIEHENMPMA